MRLWFLCEFVGKMLLLTKIRSGVEIQTEELMRVGTMSVSSFSAKSSRLLRQVEEEMG